MNSIRHIMRRNGLLHDIIEGKIIIRNCLRSGKNAWHFLQFRVKKKVLDFDRGSMIGLNGERIFRVSS